MSSDYIPRLRQELLRAGAASPAHRRRRRLTRGLVPLAAASAAVASVAAVALALVLAWPADPGDEATAPGPADGVTLSYRVDPAGTAAAEQTANVLRERLAASGLGDTTVAVEDDGARLTLTFPPAAQSDVTALTERGRVAFYDWERSVLGPDGTPAPGDDSVTGGPDAGVSESLSRAEAEERAARAPGGHVVRAPEFVGDRWFALGGDPAITHADIARAVTTTDPVIGEPVVAIEFTPAGQDAFTALTRELARRGADRADNLVERRRPARGQPALRDRRRQPDRRRPLHRLPGHAGRARRCRRRPDRRRPLAAGGPGDGRDPHHRAAARRARARGAMSSTAPARLSLRKGRYGPAARRAG